MASGFFEISKTENYPIRWTGYDEILKMLIFELLPIHKEPHDSLGLIKMIEDHIPSPDHTEELEMGWGFIDEKREDTIRRIFKIHYLSDKNRFMFWKGMRLVHKGIVEKGDSYSKLHPEFVEELIDLGNPAGRL